MTDDELRDFAMDFRLGILGGGSPEGMCFAVSAPLSGLLGACGIDAELVESDHSQNPESVFYEHVWIRLPDGRVLDPTFDQFCSEEPVPIYLGKPTEFHQAPIPHGSRETRRFGTPLSTLPKILRDAENGPDQS